MSWLNLKRLLPSRKVWELLKNKLPLKISKSMAKKKPRRKVSSKTTKKVDWPSSRSVHPNKFKIRPNNHHRGRYCKSPKPVFIDRLFVDPVSGGHAPVEEEAPAKGRSRSAIHMKKGGVLDKSGNHNMMSADDVWESMVLTSPHVHGIDERAEEFIARIKSEMRHQEILARGL